MADAPRKSKKSAAEPSAVKKKSHAKRAARAAAHPVATAPAEPLVAVPTPAPAVPKTPDPTPGAEPVAVARQPLPARMLVLVALAGVIFAVIIAIILNRPVKPQPPAFQPSANPYPHAIPRKINNKNEQDKKQKANIK